MVPERNVRASAIHAAGFNKAPSGLSYRLPKSVRWQHEHGRGRKYRIGRGPKGQEGGRVVGWRFWILDFRFWIVRPKVSSSSSRQSEIPKPKSKITPAA